MLEKESRSCALRILAALHDEIRRTVATKVRKPKTCKIRKILLAAQIRRCIASRAAFHMIQRALLVLGSSTARHETCAIQNSAKRIGIITPRRVSSRSLFVRILSGTTSIQDCGHGKMERRSCHKETLGAPASMRSGAPGVRLVKRFLSIQQRISATDLCHWDWR